MELSDFNEEQALSVKDYELEHSSGVPLNTKTAAQVAASTTLVNGEATVEEFRRTREDLLSQQGRQNFILQQAVKRDRILSEARNSLTGVLLDPVIPPEDKLTFINSAKNPDNSWSPSTINVLSEESLVADSGQDETEQTFESRTLMFDSIQAVNESKRQSAALINSLQLGENSSTTKTLKDFGELLVPFAEWVNIQQLSKETLGETTAGLMGTQKAALFDFIKQYPVEDRARVVEGLIKIVRENDGVLLPDGNDIIALDNLEKMAGLADYSKTEEWFDNVVGILDIVGVGAATRTLVKGAKGAKTATKVATPVEKALEEKFLSDMARTKFRTTQTSVIPTSPSQIVKDTNPDTARKLHLMVADDVSDEASEALYGTSRSEAMANDLLPEPPVLDGGVRNKVSMTGPQFAEPENLRVARTEQGNLALTENELVRVYDDIQVRLENVEGMMPHKESTVIRLNDDGTTTYRMMFHPQDSGFKTAANAIENAKFAFRNFGMTEENFVLYSRQGDKWVETSQKEIAAKAALREGFVKAKKKIPENLKEIDYAVGIDYNYRVMPSDVQTFERFTVKRNWADYLPNGPLVKSGQGSLTQHLFPADNVLHRQITLPANAAVDKSVGIKKLYVDTFRDFAKTYSGLKTDRRALMSDYIREANFKGLKFDTVDLRARGFNDGEIEALKTWRRGNDALYFATNQDMAVSLRNKGYMIFQDASNSRLVAKPFKRQAVGPKTEIYDVAANKTIHLDKDSLDNLYNGGGSVAKLSAPVEVNGQWLDHILVPNTPSSGYLRTINDTDAVLNYRDGYYPVMYDASFFVERTLPNGKKVVMASARTREEAEHATKQLQAANPTHEIDYRKDLRSDPERARDLSEDAWNVATSAGLSNQRIRGQRLADAGNNLQLAGSSNLHDPLESVAQQINSLSRRVAMRPYLDTVKSRWIANYANELDLPKNKFGETGFPSDISQIKGKNKTSLKTLADARSMFNYIHHLEDGYINTIDNGTKALMHWGADRLADVGLSGLEAAVRGADNINPTNKLKGTVFKLFLAANPPRQLVIQGHQMVQLTAITPQYLLTGGLSNDLYRIGRVMRGATDDAEAMEMYREIQKSGFLEAVDANNLVRQDELRLADLTWSQKAKSVGNAPLKAAQVIGFDTAERFVLVTSWLAHRDRAVKQGKVLTRRTYEEIAGESRSFTYSMNRAGDMPYNQNSLNVVAQFLQVPHKALLQPLTNRNLTRTQRAQLLTFNTVMYGVPAGVMANFIYPNMEPGTSREVLEHGLEDVLLNSVLSAASGQKQEIDWGDLAPSDIHGMGDFVVGLATLDVGKMVAEAPATSLFFGGNPRLTNAFKTTARYFHLVDDYDDPQLDTKFTDVALASANLFSGFSNAFKMKYAYETGIKMNSLGNLTDSDVTKVEAVMQGFGFQTKTESGTRKSKELLYGGAEFNPSDVNLWYTELKRQLARRGQSVREKEINQRVLAEAWRVFGLHEQKARRELMNLVQKDAKRGEYDFVQNIVKQMGLASNNEVREMIEVLPESEFKDALRFDLEYLIRAQERITGKDK